MQSHLLRCFLDEILRGVLGVDEVLVRGAHPEPLGAVALAVLFVGGESSRIGAEPKLKHLRIRVHVRERSGGLNRVCV